MLSLWCSWLHCGVVPSMLEDSWHQSDRQGEVLTDILSAQKTDQIKTNQEDGLPQPSTCPFLFSALKSSSNIFLHLFSLIHLLILSQLLLCPNLLTPSPHILSPLFHCLFSSPSILSLHYMISFSMLFQYFHLHSFLFFICIHFLLF